MTSLLPAAEELERLAGLALHVRRGMGARIGERRFPGHPQPAGTEIEGWAAYTPGDDLRHLEWSALGRLDALFVRRFTAEREVLFHLLIDGSASMDAPPVDGKLAAAHGLAMRLAFVALAAGDAVRIVPLRTGALRPSPVYRHRTRAARVAAFLDDLAAGGSLDLGAGLTSWARRHPRGGVVLVVSDFTIDPEALRPGLVALAARRAEVVLLHVIGASELDPALVFSHALLEDAESAVRHPIALTPSVRARYDALLREHLGALEVVAARTGARYARLVAGASLEDFLTGDLARLGVVRRR